MTRNFRSDTFLGGRRTTLEEAGGQIKWSQGISLWCMLVSSEFKIEDHVVVIRAVAIPVLFAVMIAAQQPVPVQIHISAGSPVRTMRGGKPLPSGSTA